ncbi:DUF2062 domain-containing protein [Tropicimonas sp. IMCC34043]|uniref:DUF2062 domain-containing protein n=1 Tax=Tropicimonas sp. IMCC34043 TaxID=2248760 RepID=UPI000E22A138|nr:DUF2062 domain-containing protein [Tropicimonas sp. IMCC34043]
MVFKRRDRRSWKRIIVESVWPRGGWGRAALYFKHRLGRLPDRPHRIARGIFAGVFVSFTPFYGLHFLTAFIMARIVGGNLLAALTATFVGNPITFPFIAAISLKTGYWILGLEPDPLVRHHLENEFPKGMNTSLIQKFSGAFGDLYHNFGTVFTGDPAHWQRLEIFYHQVFLPFLVGGIIPGFIAGCIAYKIALPIITAYQNRRQKMLEKKLAEIRAAAVAKRAKPEH